MGSLGKHFHRQYNEGNRDIIGLLKAEESNLLRARSLARHLGLWSTLLDTMQGLYQLYDHSGRGLELARLVGEIEPDFVDPTTGNPQPGREDSWIVVTQYRVRAAMAARRWKEAESLQQRSVEWSRARARTEDRSSIRTLAACLHELGQIRRGIGLADCLEAYRESFDLTISIHDNTPAATVALNLGNAYSDLPALLNLDKAQRWYRESLRLRREGDRLGRARCLGQPGAVAFRRFQGVLEFDRPVSEAWQYLTEATHLYQEALQTIPGDAIGDLARAHNHLASAYQAAGRTRPRPAPLQ
ncbi:MAG: hypothetical protein ABSH32_21910 [Bryobacteraceae bacterium]|jgi:tetratricopeptide (TPR) repeat protein